MPESVKDIFTISGFNLKEIVAEARSACGCNACVPATQRSGPAPTSCVMEALIKLTVDALRKGK